MPRLTEVPSQEGLDCHAFSWIATPRQVNKIHGVFAPKSQSQSGLPATTLGVQHFHGEDKYKGPCVLGLGPVSNFGYLETLAVLPPPREHRDTQGRRLDLDRNKSAPPSPF